MKRRLTNRQIQQLAYDRSQPPGPEGHDAVVAGLVELRDQLDVGVLARQFLAAYGDGPIEHLSMLPTFAIYRYFEEHRFSPHPTAHHCTYCGDYPTVEIEPSTFAEVNAARFDGTPVFDTLGEAYACFVLYRADDLAPPEPAQVEGGAHEIRTCLQQLDRLVEEDPDATYSQVLRRHKKLIPGKNTDDRHIFLLPFGALGILQPPGHPSHRTGFITSEEANERRLFKSEVPYPLQHWHAGDGVCWEAAKEWFGPTIADPRPRRR